MKVLITKSDGTPTKSKAHALQFLEKNGISKDLLIEENGQFYYKVDDVLGIAENTEINKIPKQVQGDKVQPDDKQEPVKNEDVTAENVNKGKKAEDKKHKYININPIVF